ncbi:hypothetical protein TWF506_002757 [Arthrobotrys conoides]|uniref:RanBD1 domain-containing protein n=1 Tax=Arthrobotrys conoides TaxID=74498 RepID=A0AAN8MY49_9PEZI
MVSTRRSKGSPPALLAQDSDLYSGVLSQQSDIFPSALSQSYTDPQPLSQSLSSPRNKKRRRSPRQNGSQSPTSGADSPKSDSSAREKMRKTRIEESEHVPKSSQENADEMVDVQAGEVSPGGNRRKRPHDEITSTIKDAKTPSSEAENRSPSRAANGEPLGKKLRETPSPPRDVDNTSAENEVAENGDSKPATQKEELKIQPGSGFSNTSAVSPFGSLGTKVPENSSTDTHSNPPSGFAASKFSTFSGSASAFGVTPSPLAGPSPFAGPPMGSDNIFSKMSSASTQSVFSGPPAGGANVFAKLSGNIGGSTFGSSGFGSSGFGAAASPFGSSGSIFGNSLSTKPLPKAQPLAGIKSSDKPETEEQDSENEDTDGEDAEVAASGEGESSKNPQFASKVAIKSGEEDYDMVFQARAKLFELGSGAWKERGIGNIRVLVPKPEEEFDEPAASKRSTVGRIVMRQEGVGRLILNTSMFRNMLPDGRTPAENTIRLLAVNTVPLAEAQDESENKKDSDETQHKNTEEEENGSADKKDEPQHAVDAKPVLKTYLLRFKGGDLAKTFKEHVSENLPE